MKKSYVFLLSLVFLVYMGFQIYNAYTNGVATERASLVSISETISLDGVFARNEVLLTTSLGNATYALVGEGEKVSVGQLVASFYPSLSDVEKMLKADEIKQTIDALSLIEDSVRSGGSDYYTVQDQIETKINALVHEVKNTSAAVIGSAKSEIDLLIAKKDMITGKKKDFSAEKSVLQSERDALLRSAGERLGDLYAVQSGYYSSSVDGYEAVIPVGDLLRLTPDKLSEILSTPPQPSAAAGKIITEHEWYFAALASEDQENRLRVGQSVTIEPESIKKPAKAEIVRISDAQDGQCAVVFKSGVAIDKSGVLRRDRCEITIRNYNGIRVPTDAIRIVDGRRGVFVLTGAKAQFKEINILFDEDGYVVAKEDVNDTDSLKNYDEIIVRARNLYDGKVIE